MRLKRLKQIIMHETVDHQLLTVDLLITLSTLEAVRKMEPSERAFLQEQGCTKEFIDMLVKE